MRRYTIAWLGLIANIAIVLLLMCQGTKNYLLWRQASLDIEKRKIDVAKKTSWKNRLISKTMYSSIALNPLLVLIGLLGNLQTPVVIVCFIFVNIVLVADFCISLGYMRLKDSDDFAESLESFQLPTMYTFYGYGIYFLMRMVILVLLLL